MKIGGFTSNIFTQLLEKLSSSATDGEKAVGYDNELSALFDFGKNSDSDSSSASMSIDDLLNMEVSDGKLVNSKNGNEDSNNTDLTKIINEYLDEESVIKALDSDNSGNLSKSEVNAFFNTIKGNDKNLEDVSLSDVYEASKQIENNEFKLVEEDSDSEETTEASEEAGNETAAEEAAGSDATEGASSGGNSGGVNGGSSPTGGASTSGINGSQYDIKAEGQYENMTEDELNAELSDAETGLQEGQEALNAVFNGSNEAVQTAQENIDNTYNSYQEQLTALNETMAKELDEIKQAGDEKEKQVDTKKMEVSEQNTTVSECQSNYDNAVSTRQSLETTLSSLQSALSGAEEEEKAAIEAQIAAVEAQLEAAKQKEDETKTKLDEAKTKLEQLKQEQTTLEQEKTNIDQQEMAKNQEIVAAYPELTEKQMAYSSAKSEYDTVKAQEEQKANALISNNQNIKNSVQAELTSRENKENEKENTSSIKGMYDEEEGLSLVETAKKMLAKYGSTTGWCATGVSRTMLMHFGIQMGGHGYQWDSNMDQLVDQGMFREVTSEYASADELSNLPAGAVVCWEATGGSSGGAKYGHVTIADGNGGEISDHYQKNIYKSVGGRSDQYRIYVPV